MDITVITPTYNRGENLKKLYNSLIIQTNKNFEWMIIDDGSSDKTQEIVGVFVEQNEIKIRYIKKENGGKHTALNQGIKQINSELTFIVDSDDWLECDAIENVLKIHKKYRDKNEICGYSFLRKFSDGNVNGKTLQEDEIVGNYIDIRINGNDINADKAEVWKTKCLKECPFPEFENEKFLGEDVVWIKLAKKYNMIFLNKAIYISEYLNDGLTKNRRKNNIKSPKGCVHRAKTILEVGEHKKINIIFFVKSILQYQIYGMFDTAKIKIPFNKIRFKILYIFLFPISLCLYIKWKNDFVEKK